MYLYRKEPIKTFKQLFYEIIEGTVAFYQDNGYPADTVVLSESEYDLIKSECKFLSGWVDNPTIAGLNIEIK